MVGYPVAEAGDTQAVRVAAGTAEAEGIDQAAAGLGEGRHRAAAVLAAAVGCEAEADRKRLLTR